MQTCAIDFASLSPAESRDWRDQTTFALRLYVLETAPIGPSVNPLYRDDAAALLARGANRVAVSMRRESFEVRFGVYRNIDDALAFITYGVQLPVCNAEDAGLVRCAMRIASAMHFGATLATLCDAIASLAPRELLVIRPEQCYIFGTIGQPLSAIAIAETLRCAIVRANPAAQTAVGLNALA